MSVLQTCKSWPINIQTVPPYLPPTLQDSNSSGRWRRVKGIQREIETASPLSAAKVLDFDSGSNSSFTNSAASIPAVDETSIVYGPTTRRQWNEYVKRPQSQSNTENDNDSSVSLASVCWLVMKLWYTIFFFFFACFCFINLSTKHSCSFLVMILFIDFTIGFYLLIHSNYALLCCL